MKQMMAALKTTEGYERCLCKAVQKTGALLDCKDTMMDPEQIHEVKAILYAAIERAWMESERILGVQRMLRELLMLTAIKVDPKPEDHDQARRLLGWLSMESESLSLKSQISDLRRNNEISAFRRSAGSEG